MSIIQVEKLTKVYRSHRKQEGLVGSVKALFNRQYNESRAVDAVSFGIEQGELVGMLGANGAGKTTILKMLSGLLYPTEGTARVAGFTPWERRNGFRQIVSLVMGQRNQLWWDLPAADAMLLNRDIYGIPDNLFRQRRDHLAGLLDVADKLHIQVRRLSLGERMKCELIGSLLHAPRVLFLDEPTIGLDVVAQQTVREFIRAYNQSSDTTIILTSHYMDDIQELCKRVIVVDDGKLMFDGGLDRLVQQYTGEKMLKVELSDKVDRQEFEKFGVIVEYQPEYCVLRVPREGMAAAASEILNRFPVTDLTIEETPIEDVIRTIFNKEEQIKPAPDEQ